MRVFFTGTPGFIGPAIASELIGAGRQEPGFACQDAAASSLEAVGVEAHRPSISRR